ncbi:MAG: hypothetical protein SVZ03_17440 [Spirochaetota bacterium]|nr:hypothetical protein [Spirochaetota bacterium]
MKNQDIQTELINAVNNGDDIVFLSYSMLDDTEDRIKLVLQIILKNYQKDEWFTPLYSCIKELLSNAIKANAKRILIDEGVIKDPDNIIEVVNKLRTILNEESLLEYGIKVKEKRLSTRIFLMVQDDTLIIKVVNNLRLSSRELKRINDRIEKSYHYDSIAEFYLDNPDPVAEGMGLGLSMVVVLLKNIDIDPHNFTVTTDGREKTYAKIEIPLN